MKKEIVEMIADDHKKIEITEPLLSKKRSESYDVYWDSYLDTISELKDELQGLGIEFDKLSINLKDEEEHKGIIKEVVEKGINLKLLKENEILANQVKEAKLNLLKLTEESKISNALVKERENIEEEAKKIEIQQKKEKNKKIQDKKLEELKTEVIENKLLVKKSAYIHEMKVRRELENDLYKDSVHKEISINNLGQMIEGISIICSMCNWEEIVGIRYLCIQCSKFNLCSIWEKVYFHEHPLLKLKTSHDILSFIENLKGKNQEKPNPVEEWKEPLNRDQPIIIDAPKEPIKIDPYYQESDKYPDEILKDLSAVLVQMMPRSGHIINTISSDICLTVNLKNTGEIEWPKGFKIWSDQGKFENANF